MSLHLTRRKSLLLAMALAYSPFNLLFLVRSSNIGIVFPQFLSIFATLLGMLSVIGLLTGQTWWIVATVSFGISVFLCAFGDAVNPGLGLFRLALGTTIGLLVLCEATDTQANIDNVDQSSLDHENGQEDKPMTSPIEAQIENGAGVDFLKYKLERERFQWERSTQTRENRLFNRHFGVIITTIISCAAIAVSYLQLTISSNNAHSQLDNEKLRNDRQFYLEAARFLLDHEGDLRTENPDRIAYFRDVIVLSFPPEVARQIVVTMGKTARSADARQIWYEGLRRLPAPSTLRPE